ncbi:hypothetical protein FH972_001504 [Carpinus fangiana]|uniref:Delta(3)-Delta(2)-enoyl-CoA isomerase n=1 Tax=Carpinus fangiana TaxID=176857 RepID=A0A5N6QEK5_9ROSI|nr:hypothetical protein FH972_001504 [Carpinus fangiana]
MSLDRGRSPPRAKRFRSSERASYRDAPYPRDRRINRQDYLCNKCKRPGHFARDCPNMTVCNNCGLPGWEVLFVISSAVLVASLAISAVTAFLLSSASTVVEGATKPMSALLLECLTVASIGEGDEHRLNPTLLDAIHSAIRQVRAECVSSESSALITTAQGKFFSNGYDLAWAGSSQARIELMGSKFDSLVADLISLPMPTIAAVSGHASASGFMLALSHDYVLMRKDRGFLYMSEVDISLVIPAWFIALIECKIGDPLARRDVVLKGAKVTAKEAVEKRIIDSAHDGPAGTVSAAIRLGEELVGRGWNGHVYAQIRMKLLARVLDEIGAWSARSRM